VNGNDFEPSYDSMVCLKGILINKTKLFSCFIAHTIWN